MVPLTLKKMEKVSKCRCTKLRCLLVVYWLLKVYSMFGFI